MASNINYSRWMSENKYIQEKTLATITIPGAHDAGMGKISSKPNPLIGDNVVQTQDLSFYEMLNNGVRYFDVRPVLNPDGKMYLGHFGSANINLADYEKDLKTGDTSLGDIKLGDYNLIDIPQNIDLGYQGCYGYSMDEVLTDVKRFVSDSENNKEVIILKISHFLKFVLDKNELSILGQSIGKGLKNVDYTNADIDTLKEKIESNLGAYLVKNNNNFLNTNIKDLTSNGAKIIITFDRSDFDESKGIYSEASLNLIDEYSNTPDFQTMKQDQLKKMVDNNNKKYFTLSWTLTQNFNTAILSNFTQENKLSQNLGIEVPSIKHLALIANSNFYSIEDKAKTSKAYPNILYTDYVSSEVTDAVIKINDIRFGITPEVKIETREWHDRTAFQSFIEGLHFDATNKWTKCRVIVSGQGNHTGVEIDIKVNGNSIKSQNFSVNNNETKVIEVDNIGRNTIDVTGKIKTAGDLIDLPPYAADIKVICEYTGDVDELVSTNWQDETSGVSIIENLSLSSRTWKSCNLLIQGLENKHTTCNLSFLINGQIDKDLSSQVTLNGTQSQNISLTSTVFDKNSCIQVIGNITNSGVLTGAGAKLTLKGTY